MKKSNNFFSLITPEHIIQFYGLTLTGVIIFEIIKKFNNIEFTDKKGNKIKANN